MKDRYSKLKKQIKTQLGLGTTVGAIGVFSLFSEMVLFGLILIFIGGIILFITYIMKKETKNLEEECKKTCITCGKEVKHSIENRYFIADNLVKKSDYDNANNNKKRMEIHYYKCEDCSFCLTIIHTYICTLNNKEKQLNDKVNMDFDYTGDY